MQPQVRANTACLTCSDVHLSSCCSQAGYTSSVLLPLQAAGISNDRQPDAGSRGKRKSEAPSEELPQSGDGAPLQHRRVRQKQMPDQGSELFDTVGCICVGADGECAVSSHVCCTQAQRLKSTISAAQLSLTSPVVMKCTTSGSSCASGAAACCPQPATTSCLQSIPAFSGSGLTDTASCCRMTRSTCCLDCLLSSAVHAAAGSICLVAMLATSCRSLCPWLHHLLCPCRQPCSRSLQWWHCL